MGEGVGRDPHDGLPQHFSLVVNAFDGQEDLEGGRDSMVKTKGTVGKRADGALPRGPGLTLRRARAAMM